MSKDAEKVPASPSGGKQAAEKVDASGVSRRSGKMPRGLIAQTALGIVFSIAVLVVLVYFTFVGVPS